MYLKSQYHMHPIHVCVKNLLSESTDLHPNPKRGGKETANRVKELGNTTFDSSDRFGLEHSLIRLQRPRYRPTLNPNDIILLFIGTIPFDLDGRRGDY